MGKGKAQSARLLYAPPLRDLEHQPTIVLLQELRRMRVEESIGYVEPRTNCCTDCADHKMAAYLHERQRDIDYITQLKAELAKREHIPNKQERKAIRQQKAQAQRHRGS